MRNFLFSSFIFSCLFIGSTSVSAAESDNFTPPDGYAAQRSGDGTDNDAEKGERAIIDLMAADFYENTLRRAQSFKIEAQTALDYQQLSKSERQRFRVERREIWKALSEEQRQSLRDVKHPQFINLSEAQKDTFRNIAVGQLSSTPAPETDQAQLRATRNNI